MRKNTNVIQSLDRGIAIMQYLANRKSASVTEIASTFNIDKSTASRNMMTLVKRNMVYKNTDTQKYSLSIGSLQFSYHIEMKHVIIEIARPILKKLSNLTQETAHLCSMQNDQIFLLSQFKSRKNHFLKHPVMPGMTEPYHCSAASKIILANMDLNNVRKMLKAYSLYGYTKNTITDADELMAHLNEVRKRNYALDIEEFKDKICCLALPVYDEYGFASYSIGITGDKEDFESEQKLQRNIYYLRKASQELTSLYYQHCKESVY